MPLIFHNSFYIINQYEDNNELKIFWISGIDKKEFLNQVVKFLIFSYHTNIY